MVKEFREFILRGSLVDLAVAVVIGTAFTALVTSLVANLITPLIAAVGGQPDFSALTFEINGSEFRYGAFLNALFSFLVIAAVVFFLVVKPVNALLSRVEERAEPEASTADIQLLTEIRDLLREQAAGRTTRYPGRDDPGGAAGRIPQQDR
jgi:large conductance mechanosensitive channel